MGHIGGDDFIVVCPFEFAETVAKNITTQTDQTTPSFYNEEDRKNGYMLSENRKGELEKFPLLSIGIGIVHNQGAPLHSVTQISERGTHLKSLAKQHPGSSYEIEPKN